MTSPPYYGLRDYQENGYYEDGDRRNYGIKIVTDQTETQEAKEQIQIVPYEPVAPPQIESSPEKTEDWKETSGKEEKWTSDAFRVVNK